MYKIVDEQGNVFSQYHYAKETEFEDMVVAHKKNIFGAEGIYFNIKKKIGQAKKGAAIPDGYYLDLTFHADPKLYLVEIEKKTVLLISNCNFMLKSANGK